MWCKNQYKLVQYLSVMASTKKLLLHYTSQIFNSIGVFRSTLRDLSVSQVAEKRNMDLKGLSLSHIWKSDFKIFFSDFTPKITLFEDTWACYGCCKETWDSTWAKLLKCVLDQD